ncbi:hypothetical protein ASG25_03270 [Rhizobium sp. Leaf384]|uniref:DUF2147 domain-containing protein n=1 Tax=unclassified Rhizobium TaxID=2613769 RepID=UPI000714DAFD|nr:MULTISPECIES: DUF2147 domain-containing protein [unclassified Rhizobium]KQR70848.1 hypothetical protein ASG03_04515 [Rhizobium sp. Leaf341]KQS80608.1 hypothetical protein ASG25_03270 [Rhizobium sp. Leaf384]KQS82546.1 hypothetical protein ASG58_04085 [Rhizobium sp. Leaf383]
MKILSRLSAAALGAALFALPAFAAEPIVGNWKTANGETAAIESCGGSFCITVKTGKHAGKKIGTLSGSGESYTGEVTDPNNDKTYSGSAAVTGSQLKLKGCVLKVLCKSQTWSRL